MSIVHAIKDAIDGKPLAKRSPQWPAVERDHLRREPDCQVCGGKKQLNVHHKKPFHLFRELELDPANLITLCNAKRCHVMFGHGGDFKAWNPNVVSDVLDAKRMIQGRKYER
jgi:5-methylcytosine-specific restriction endonuclease McrA